MIHQFDFLFDRHTHLIDEIVDFVHQRDRRLHVLVAAGMNLSVASALHQKAQDRLSFSRVGFEVVNDRFDTISFMGLHPGAAFFFDDIAGGERKSQSVELVNACLRAGGSAFVLLKAATQSAAKRRISEIGLAHQRSRLTIDGVIST